MLKGKAFCPKFALPTHHPRLTGIKSFCIAGSNARDISGEGPVRQWVASVFFVVTSITTTGYGDIAPVNAAEELVAALIMLIGVVAFGFIIAGSQ